MSDYDDARGSAALRRGSRPTYDAEFANMPGHVRGRPWRGAPTAVAIQLLRRRAHLRRARRAERRAGRRLLAEHGFAPGDRLAVYLQNIPQFVVALLAAWKAGGVDGVDQPDEPARELTYLLKDSGRQACCCASRRCTTTVGPRRRGPDTDVRIGRSPPASWTYQTRNDERLFAGASPRRAEGTTDFAELIDAARAASGPPPVALRRRRRRVPDLHLGHDRACRRAR